MKIIQIFVWSITVTLAFVYAAIFQWTLNPPTIHISKVTVVAPTSTKQIVENSEKKEGVWALRWKDDEGEIILATSTYNTTWSDFDTYSQVGRYTKEDGEFIFFFRKSEEVTFKRNSGTDKEYETQYTNYSLILFDTKNKTEKVIFDLKKDFSKFTDAQVFPGQILIIGNGLFFAFVGDYLPAGKMYHVDLLDPLFNVEEIPEGATGRIVNKWGYYWLYTSFGDGCCGGGSYTWFDPVSLNTGEVVSFSGNAFEGVDNFLGIINNEIIVMAYNQNKEIGVESTPIYSKVTVHALNKDQNVTTLFDTKNILPNTTDVFLDEENGKLYLIGDGVWVYDFGTKETIKYTPAKSLYGFHVKEFLEGDRVCLVNWETDRITKARAIWDMTDNSVEYSDIASCESKAEDESIKADRLLPEGLPQQLEVVEM
ncbi:MAG TPA: hypothetical protein PK295_02240 [Candidatus Magasanikbacteria bacterium]|nr:hypothetical protein [Candidatus Magasanikbacteria bacterium]